MRRPGPSIRPSTRCPAGYDETTRQLAGQAPAEVRSRGGRLVTTPTRGPAVAGAASPRRDPGSRGAPGRGWRRRLSAARPDRPVGVPSRLRRLSRQRRDPRPPERARAGAGGRREPRRYLDELHRRRQRAAGGARRRRRDQEGAHRARGDRRRLEDRLRPRTEPRSRQGARRCRAAVPRDGALPARLLALRTPGRFSRTSWHGRSTAWASRRSTSACSTTPSTSCPTRPTTTGGSSKQPATSSIVASSWRSAFSRSVWRRGRSGGTACRRTPSRTPSTTRRRPVSPGCWPPPRRRVAPATTSESSSSR